MPRESYDEGGRGERGIFWLFFCGPGALLMWFARMFPSSTEEAIAAYHRQDNVFVQFLMTLAFWAIVVFIWWILSGSGVI